MEFGVIGRTTEGFFRYQGWPTVAKDDAGTIYAASSGHRLGHVCPFGKDYLYISKDGAKTWLGPIVANDNCMDDRDAGLCAWGDGNVLLSWFSHGSDLYDKRAETTAVLNTPLALGVREAWKTIAPEEYHPGSYVKLSRDGGKTWSEKVQVPVTAPHGPIRRADGSLFYLGKAFKSNDPNAIDGHIYAYESRDDGMTWTQLCHLDIPEGFSVGDVHEPHAVELPDGTILGGIRGSGPNVPGKNRIFTTFSTDGGKTFSKAVLLDLIGTPPHFLLHSSGAVVMTYGRRIAPCGERAMISYDGGKTWGEELVISEEAPDWDLGYPSSIELDDGSILTVYYQKYPGDSYCSVLYTRWELPEKK